MKGIRKYLWVVAAFLSASLFVGGTLAAWTAESPAVHVINTGSLDGQIVEEYTVPGALEPGTKVTKIVNVKNTGNVDLLARVKLTKAWGSSRDSAGKLIVDPSLSVDNIVLEVNTTYWVYDAADGYYYYKGILKPGETTAEPLLKSFTVSSDTGNAYKNKQADIVVDLECIQTGIGAEAVTDLWGKTYAYFGVAAPTAGPGTKTYAWFVSPAARFAFNPESTDLFADFKDLVPGETRMQQIGVGNRYAQTVTIYLRAEYVEQSDVTLDAAKQAQNLALVEKMLREYAQITVVNNANGAILYQGAVWGNYPNTPSPTTPRDSMRNYISLGAFAFNTYKDLTVTLTLDKSLDNTYQNLWGKIQWRLLTMGDDPNPSYPPLSFVPSSPTPTSSVSSPSPSSSSGTVVTPPPVSYSPAPSAVVRTPAPGQPEVPPTDPGQTLVPDGDGYVVVDDNGTPLGYWGLNDDGVWVYDEYTPLGSGDNVGIVRTGDLTGSYIAWALALVMAVAAIWLKRSANKQQRSEQ